MDRRLRGAGMTSSITWPTNWKVIVVCCRKRCVNHRRANWAVSFSFIDYRRLIQMRATGLEAASKESSAPVNQTLWPDSITLIRRQSPCVAFGETFPRSETICFFFNATGLNETELNTKKENWNVGRWERERYLWHYIHQIEWFIILDPVSDCFNKVQVSSEGERFRTLEESRACSGEMDTEWFRGRDRRREREREREIEKEREREREVDRERKMVNRL